jgi:UDP-N-acetylglucosamine 2-epimerase (non-hydrolysing)
MGHLAAEGLLDRAVLVGDVMTDVCLCMRDAVRDAAPVLPTGVDADTGYVVSTIHRAENTDEPMRLRGILHALSTLPVPVVLLAHPRLVARCREFEIELDRQALHAAKPLSYPQMVSAMLHSRGVVTDSGGLQKEAFLLGVPCTTIRSETEWIETLVDGWNVLDPDLQRLAELAARRRPTSRGAQPYGDGAAAMKVAAELAARA